MKNIVGFSHWCISSEILGGPCDMHKSCTAVSRSDYDTFSFCCTFIEFQKACKRGIDNTNSIHSDVDVSCSNRIVATFIVRIFFVHSLLSIVSGSYLSKQLVLKCAFSTDQAAILNVNDTGDLVNRRFRAHWPQNSIRIFGR